MNSSFYVFLSFRNLAGVKRTKSFWSIIFSWKYIATAEEVNMEPHEGAKRRYHAAPPLGRLVGPISPLLALLPLYLDQRMHRDLKPTIYMTSSMRSQTGPVHTYSGPRARKQKRPLLTKAKFKMHFISKATH
jgi:hypothetical protein